MKRSAAGRPANSAGTAVFAAGRGSLAISASITLLLEPISGLPVCTNKRHQQLTRWHCEQTKGTVDRFLPYRQVRLLARGRHAAEGAGSGKARPVECPLRGPGRRAARRHGARPESTSKPVVRFFQQQGIDALFIPHCNFGTEGAAGMIAKQCGVPTLLWAPRDEAPLPDGTRLRDSLCGMLATSGVLNTLRVRSPTSTTAASTTRNSAAALIAFAAPPGSSRRLRSMKIGQIGQRIDFFWSTITNEADLLQRFGIQVLPIDLVDLCRTVRKRTEANRDAYRKELASSGSGSASTTTEATTTSCPISRSAT